jgi:hypothetical protein
MKNRYAVNSLLLMTLRIVCPCTIGTSRSASRAKGIYRSVAVVTALSVGLTGATAAKNAAHVPLPPSNPLKNTEQEKQQKSKPAMFLFSQKQLPTLGRAMILPARLSSRGYRTAHNGADLAGDASIS